MITAKELRSRLSEILISPRRMVLDTPDVQATVPMLRGVWGAALHDLDPEAYEAVFQGRGSPHERAPAYVLRPAPPNPEDAPAIDWIVIGSGIDHDQSLMRAWDVASGMGLGTERRRFNLKAIRPLTSQGLPVPPRLIPRPWPLSEACFSDFEYPESDPCRLTFHAPLRLVRRHRLITNPGLPDLIVAAIRRVEPLSAGNQEAFSVLLPELLDLARKWPAGPWQGYRLDLIRYSGRQKVELELRGISGYLDLPEGAGVFWPLLAAAQWLHLGKGTTVGLGQPIIEPILKP